MRTKQGIGVVPFLLLAVVVHAQQTAPAAPQKSPGEKRNITIEDNFLIKRVGNAQISPEGKWVAYTVGTTDLKEERSETQLWMVPLAGGEAIPMTGKGTSAGRPRWSPDGKYLAFQASRGGGPEASGARSQVWLLNRMGGEAQQLTEVKQGIQSFDWSPDSKKLVLVIRDPSPEEAAEREAQPGAAPRRPRTQPPWVVDRLQFKRDGAGYLDRRRSHLYVFDVATKKVVQITSGDFEDSQPAWSPDGRFIAFVSNRTDEPDSNNNSDIWVVAADNPDQGKTLIRVTSNPGGDSGPAWSPDGKWIAHTTAKAEPGPYAMRYLAVSPAQGGAARVLTEKLDRNIGSPTFSPDGKFIYFLLEDSGEDHLARIPLGGGEITRPIAGPRSVGGIEISKEGVIVTRISEPNLPGELFVLDGTQLRRLTTANDALMAQLRLAEVENIHYKSKDGTEIEGFIYKPPAFNPEMRYPTLLRIHGGPVSQYDYAFNFEAQLFAANGYVVIMTNPRGSSGYGQAFSMAIWADWGNKDSEDVLAGVDYAIQKGYADPDRLGVGGWSYGGILTNYVITRTRRFKAAVSGASLGLVTANWGHDHYFKWYEQELGSPWENRAVWEKISPFNDVAKITTPTLWICGERDWNVPVINSEQMYQSMRALGRTTQLVVYPGESHGINRPAYVKDRWERYLAWYAQHVKGEKPAASAEKKAED